ncbi:MAG: hypothetical protein O7D91_15785 [Planctomycetota bacterium]|nr:hypothetical protein [Planctomycetota bacterium]
MRRILTIFVLLGLAGCSGEGIGFGRLDVTPALQDACDGVAGGDPLIEATIHVVEEASLDGALYNDGVAATLDSCTFEACITCGVAVWNQVYGI